MIRELTIKNYKSILDHTIELGRINVFIGENGCGKTNLLEAVAMAAAALTDKLEVEELFNRGIRVAKPSITLSSFLNVKQGDRLTFLATVAAPDVPSSEKVEIVLTAVASSKIDAVWVNRYTTKRARVRRPAQAPVRPGPGVVPEKARTAGGGTARPEETPARKALRALLADFVIYSPNTPALRGIHNNSWRAPLGIHGESLDALVSTFSKKEMADMKASSELVSWVDRVLVDPGDKLKYEGHKLGRSTSTLYFKDRLMGRKNNIFSAENANEGILYILFHVALFISDQTPKVLGIDNIEAALNPQLCRDLIKQLAALAVKHDKQALITTHNPAILDGLNLHDDEQRLFVVYRNDEGHTRTRRIKVKPQPEGEKLKLSELWMRGHLGGLARNF